MWALTWFPPPTILALLSFYTYISTSIHTYLCTQLYTYIYTYISTYTHVTYIHIYISTYVETDIHTHRQTYIPSLSTSLIHKKGDISLFYIRTLKLRPRIWWAFYRNKCWKRTLLHEIGLLLTLSSVSFKSLAYVVYKYERNNVMISVNWLSTFWNEIWWQFSSHTHWVPGHALDSGEFHSYRKLRSLFVHVIEFVNLAVL